MPQIIPFSKPYIGKEELKSVNKVLKSGQLSGNGVFTKKAENLIKKKINSRHVLVTSSCTHSLEIASILLDLKEGDEVIVPSFTFVSTALAFLMHGAKIRFADVNYRDLNLNIESLKKLINKNTKAIVPVHYGPGACEMDKILEISMENNLTLIEDNAHGFLGKYKNKDLGSFGSLSSLSFHDTKNLTSGEGGALCINDEKYIERAEYIREKGTNRSKFILGQIDKYRWVG
jgi:dTDP-4-amino-4,6-dideoxygalactose transaminase